jgi:hypothetical protein
MKIRTINLDSEYPALSEWWTKRGLQPPQKLILAGAQGFAVNAGIDIVMGWIYRSGNVAFLEWITGNPTIAASPTIAQAIAVLLDFTNCYAGSQACNVILCGTQDNGSLGRFMVKRGWAKCGGRPHNFLVKAVTDED